MNLNMEDLLKLTYNKDKGGTSVGSKYQKISWDNVIKGQKVYFVKYTNGITQFIPSVVKSKYSLTYQTGYGETLTMQMTPDDPIFIQDLDQDVQQPNENVLQVTTEEYTYLIHSIYTALGFHDSIKKLNLLDIVEKLKTANTLISSVEHLKHLVDIQCSDGNWNFNPYMHGMANGLLLALAIFNGVSPKFLNPPKQWLDLHAIEKDDTNTKETA